MSSFRIIILSGAEPNAVAHLVKRIHCEVPRVTISGLIYQLPPSSKGLAKRLFKVVTSLSDPDYPVYVISKARDVIRYVLVTVGERFLRLIHACPSRPTRIRSSGLEHLARVCESLGCAVHVTARVHSPESVNFVKRLQPDLGVVWGTRLLKPELFEIPRLGSINVHRKKVPAYRGSGPTGLWELLDQQTEIGITIHRVEESLDAGAILDSAIIPIEPFDTLESLNWKAHTLGNDLLVRTIANFARGTVQESPQVGPSRIFRKPKPQQLRGFKSQIAGRRARYRAQRNRSKSNLLLRSFFWYPYWVLRNWIHRMRGTFPIVVLCHHLVSDRPHPKGIPLDLFLRHLKFLRNCYNVVSLDEAIDLLHRRRIKSPTIVLTFDRGYQDNYQNLRAAVDATGVPLALFVCSRQIGAQEEFDDDLRQGYSGFLPLTWDQVTVLAREGVEIGNHAQDILNVVAADVGVLRRRIMTSKSELETHIGARARYLSFPAGNFNDTVQRVIDVANESYLCLLFNDGKVNSLPSDNSIGHLSRHPYPNDLWELELLLQHSLNCS